MQLRLCEPLGHMCVYLFLLAFMIGIYESLAGHPILYNKTNTPDNPLQCIHNDAGIRTTFFENMSKAYAKMAREIATVMHLSQSYTDPPMDGIFGRIEVPTLRNETDITAVRTKLTFPQLVFCLTYS